jgi:hypothetical protein
MIGNLSLADHRFIYYHNPNMDIKAQCYEVCRVFYDTTDLLSHGHIKAFFNDHADAIEGKESTEAIKLAVSYVNSQVYKLRGECFRICQSFYNIKKGGTMITENQVKTFFDKDDVMDMLPSHVNTPQRALQLAMGYFRNLEKSRLRYNNDKNNNPQKHKRKSAQVAIKDKKRSDEAKQLRKKTREGGIVLPEEEKLAKRIKLQHDKYNMIPEHTAVIEDNILKKANQLAERNNDSIENILPIVRKLYATLPDGKRNEALRRLDPVDRENRRISDNKPRRKALKKKRVAMNPIRYEDKKKYEPTLEQRAKAAQKAKAYREQQKKINSNNMESTDEALLIKKIKECIMNIRQKNNRWPGPDQFFSILECSPITFLIEVFSLPCIYCNNNNDISINRIDATQPFKIGNIIPCCKICSWSKRVMNPYEFYDQCVKVITFFNGKHIVGICNYCGDKSHSLGIDRIDSTKDYTASNIVPCCSTCNYMKREYSVDKFINMTHNIRNNGRPLITQVLSSILNIYNDIIDDTINKRHGKLITNTNNEYYSGRDDNNTIVAVVSYNRIYHTDIEHSKHLCIFSIIDGVKIYKYKDFNIMLASEAIMKGLQPCRLCRLMVTTAELNLLQCNFRNDIVDSKINSARKCHMTE